MRSEVPDHFFFGESSWKNGKKRKVKNEKRKQKYEKRKTEREKMKHEKQKTVIERVNEWAINCLPA